MKKIIKYIKTMVTLMFLFSITSLSYVKAQEVPIFNMGWNNELHTGILQLAFEKPEAFENNPIHFRPVGGSRLELVSDGEVIAIVNHILTKGASESVTMMTQGQLDFGAASSPAYIQAYDSGADIKILAPVQNGGISIVGDINAKYNNFNEFVEYAKESERPVLAGYHSPISAPRVIFEYAMKEAGLNVSGDSADIDADVVLMDLKGLSNLIPSLSSGQVEIFAGPIPHPQNAEKQGVGIILDDLNTLQDGLWQNFPCCSLNCSQLVIDEHPSVVQAVMQATHDITNYAQENPVETAEALGDFLGIEEDIIIKNDTIYSTEINEQFLNGEEKYVEVLNDLGKFEGRLAGLSFEQVKELIFDFQFAENVK